MGADIHARNKDGQSILYNAAACGKSEVVQWLLSLGANFSVADKRGRTPLHTAAEKDLATAKLLKKKGADIYAHGKNRDTLLHSALNSSQVETTRWLLGLRLVPDEVDIVGQSPLHRAARNNKPKIATILLEHGASINLTDVNYRTLLYYAIYAGSDAALELLLPNKSDPYLLNGYGKSTFDWIQQNNSLGDCKFGNLLNSPPATQ